jgi:hypothetical protein
VIVLNIWAGMPHLPFVCAASPRTPLVKKTKPYKRQMVMSSAGIGKQLAVCSAKSTADHNSANPVTWFD